MSIGHATATASASALKRRRQAAGFYMFHSQLTQFYVTQLQDIPFPSLPFPSPYRRPVQLTDCVSNSMKARKMPFIIFTSRANNKPSRLFHIPHPVGPPSRHLVAVVLAFPVVFVVLWLIIIICAFYISVFYCSTFLIHTHYHTHTHTETQWHTH